jgi:hypothetical protein
MIAEAVRAAADEAPQPDPVLELLVTQVRDPGGIKPMSIANTNRLLAYFLSALSISLLAFALQLWLSGLTSKGIPALGRAAALAGIWGLLLPQLWLSLLGVRALAFWRGRCRAVVEAKVTRIPSPAPRPLSRVLDFFAWIMSKEDYYLVHGGWAPVWESVCFSLLPSCLGIYGGLWVTDQFLKAIGAPPTLIQQVVFFETIVLPLIFLGGWGVYFFALLHEYKWLEARRLRSRFETLRRDCLLYRMRVIPVNPINEYVSVGRQLWVITGHDPYRDPLQYLN